MTKKLLKYGKILLALTLIGALALPSYATVGASDGSAFVTKAEFDAALSDFNARLTTFEAGINSKIDSQVSSYLDRNGIWSGKEQTIKTQYKNGWPCEYNLCDDSATAASLDISRLNFPIYQQTTEKDGYIAGYQWGSVPSGARQLCQEDIDKQTGELIESISKSGLVMINYNVRYIIKSNNGNLSWDNWLSGVRSKVEPQSNWQRDTGGWYTTWYKNYYNKWSDTDDTTHCDNINDIAHDPQAVWWRGLYFGVDGNRTYQSWSLRPYWSFDVENSTGSTTEMTRVFGDQFQANQANARHAYGSSNYWSVVPFGDFTFTGTAQFFVQKGDKILSGGGATISGWEPYVFWSYYRTTGLAMVVQPKSVIVY